ncbi:MAG: tetratricopeptide repeat protein [Prosthecobacter sp.]
MSTLPDEDTPAGSGADAARAELRRVLLAFAVMVLVGVAAWLAYPLAARLYKSWRIHQQLSTLRGSLERREWAAAAGALREARKMAPEDPAVVRASLDFLQLRGGWERDTRGAITLVQQLQKAGAATPADLALLGRMHVLQGRTAEGQALYDQLSAEARQARPARELQADILQAQGQEQRAAEVRRGILAELPDDPASLRQLAALDMSGSPARREAMRERLWQLARTEGPVRLTAVDLLGRDKSLTTPQVEELHKIIAAAPSADPAERDAAHLQVLSGQMRISPQLREELITQELVAWKDRPPAQVRPLIQWLSREGEHDRILRVLPPALAAKFTDLLPLYVEALRRTKQWEKLDAFLTKGGIDTAFPNAQKMLWQAEVRAKLDAEPSRARQMLARLLEEAGRGDNAPLTLQVGEMAEQLGQWDLAQRCFAACADKHPPFRPIMLAKVYEMADHQHDGPAMLEACTALVALKPENPALLEQRLYLQLLLGIALETAEQQLASLPPAKGPARASQRHLMRALLAFRQGRPDLVQEPLPKVLDPATLPAGQRAVYAGLLKASGGDPAVVFRLLEKISPALLLPEEKKFAQRAW